MYMYTTDMTYCRRQLHASIASAPSAYYFTLSVHSHFCPDV